MLPSAFLAPAPTPAPTPPTAGVSGGATLPSAYLAPAPTPTTTNVSGGAVVPPPEKEGVTNGNPTGFGESSTIVNIVSYSPDSESTAGGSVNESAPVAVPQIVKKAPAVEPETKQDRLSADDLSN